MRRKFITEPMATLELPTPVGRLGLVAGRRGLFEIILAADEADLSTRLGCYDGSLKSVFSHRHLTVARLAITAYFRTPTAVGRVDFDWRGLSGFAVGVLTCLLEVPPGELISYGELARRAGSPGAARAVGGVMANNPFPILIPCHRVVGADGRMTGYSGGHGVATKQQLLEFESGYRSS